MELTFKRLNSAAELAALRTKLQAERKEKDTHRVRVCCGTACQASGSNKLVKKFEEEAAAKGVDLEIVKTGCQGFCQRGPVMIQEPQETFYQKVKVHDIPALFSGSVMQGVPYRKQLYREVPLAEPNVAMQDIPFYKKQMSSIHSAASERGSFEDAPLNCAVASRISISLALKWSRSEIL